MKKLLYNEYELAKQFYDNGLDPGNFIFWQVALLAKYLRDLGLGETRLEESLNMACEKAYSDFNRTKRIKTISYAVKQGMRFKLRKVNTIVITQEEVSSIMKVREFTKRKFLLILLCYAKILKYTTAKRDVENEYPKMYGYYVSNKYLWEIIQTARISISKKKVSHEWLYEFYQLGLIDGIAGEVDSIKVLYADEDSTPMFEIDIKDKSNILDNCAKYLGDKIVCKHCGKEFVRSNSNSKRQQYCVECAKVRRKEQARIRMSKLREKASNSNP